MKNLENSIIPIWKPKKIYSNTIVDIVKMVSKSKAGHAGTLDPFAEGVLVVCTGDKTKTISDIQSQSKRYLARIALGEETTTLDVFGDVIKRKKIPNIDMEKMESTLKNFKGKIMQSPPAFSAVRRNNVRLYSLARKDIFIKLKPREVEVFSIKVIQLKKKYIDIEVRCGKGTYIRSLARDIAIEIGTVGHLRSLKRLSIGDFDKKKCKDFEFILDENL
ncbi:MAG: tRNA pseudouridine(55) synthase TruB [Candidatus Marinimicrobia bacterium]|nr:tRNA pseudouridine(55) synthase TruB [Candidatus Neomarinimicrobiota bacterium]